jgi:hypothetical protein
MNATATFQLSFSTQKEIERLQTEEEELQKETETETAVFTK